MLFFIALAFAAHLAFLFVFGAKKAPVPRAVANVPQFQIAADGEWIALDDPTLFALPHLEDFAPAVWRRLPDVTPPSFRWTEAPPFLPPPVEVLGAAFGTFMQSNRFADFRLNFKPEPQLAVPDAPLESVLPKNSTLQIAGGLAHRHLLQPIHLPSLTNSDVLPPVKVQALVDAAGKVVSVVLLEASGLEQADTNALAFARTARFAPADRLTFGELIFNWHTVPEPAATTNAP